MARKIFAFAALCFSLAACDHVDDSAPADAESCNVDYAAVKAAEMVEINAGGAIVGKLVLGELAEEDLSEEQISLLTRWEAILGHRTRPVDEYDLRILDVADAMLAGPQVWDRADDRECEPQDKSFSLFCALYFASLDVTGSYEHRRTVMQEIRFVVEDASKGREFEHRLMDYNNLPETSFDDIKLIIQRTRQTVHERLELQAQCAL